MKPILFNTDMVRAILEDCKTVTRRVVKPQPRMVYYNGQLKDSGEDVRNGNPLYVLIVAGQNGATEQIVPSYQPGDILYVRETWRSNYDGEKYFYLADKCTPREERKLLDYDNVRWHPSIHMPKETARIFLRVTNVRVERLKDMPVLDIAFEGFAGKEILSRFGTAPSSPPTAPSMAGTQIRGCGSSSSSVSASRRPKMDYKELIELLRDENNCDVLDYIDDAYTDIETMLEERDSAIIMLHGECSACKYGNRCIDEPPCFHCIYASGKSDKWKYVLSITKEDTDE